MDAGVPKSRGLIETAEDTLEQCDNNFERAQTALARIILKDSALTRRAVTDHALFLLREANRRIRARLKAEARANKTPAQRKRERAAFVEQCGKLKTEMRVHHEDHGAMLWDHRWQIKLPGRPGISLYQSTRDDLTEAAHMHLTNEIGNRTPRLFYERIVKELDKARLTRYADRFKGAQGSAEAESIFRSITQEARPPAAAA